MCFEDCEAMTVDEQFWLMGTTSILCPLLTKSTAQTLEVRSGVIEYIVAAMIGITLQEHDIIKPFILVIQMILYIWIKVKGSEMCDDLLCLRNSSTQMMDLTFCPFEDGTTVYLLQPTSRPQWADLSGV